MPARIYQIIQKYFQNSQPKEVQKAFASWINRPVGEDEKDAALNEIWDKLDIPADASTERSFEKLMPSIQSPVLLASGERKRKITLTHKFSRIAVILLLPIISVGITYYIMKSPGAAVSGIEMVECIVPNGEIRTITLPDSSVVKINSGSILIYPREFSGNRDIFLNGEAYFTVTGDETKPFVVKTTDMDVEVLGTVFNVSSYADSGKSTATLESGKVNIRFKNMDKEPVILLADEQITYHRALGSVEKNNVKVENVIAWTKGNLVIQSMTIDEMVKVIERKYAVKVYLNSTNYKNERITMKVSNEETITEFMDVFKYLVPQLRYKIEGGSLFIY